MSVVYVKSNTTTGAGDGRVFRLREGEPWSVDDPIVKAHPELFSDEPTGHRSVPEARVEAATAAPGERRNVSKPRK